MKKITAYLLLTVAAVGIGGSCCGESPRQYDGWKLVWHDEFSKQGAPDPERWSFERGFVRNHELQWYQEENARCEDGVLVIEGRKERVRNDAYDPQSKSWRKNREFADYTSSSLKTRGKFDFLYGRLEVRARIPVSPGAWPAIWTLGSAQPWPSCGEIDLMEFYRIDSLPHVLANVACGSEKGGPRWASRKVPFSQFTARDAEWASKFHIWRMDWDQESIRLYLDDELRPEANISTAFPVTKDKKLSSVILLHGSMDTDVRKMDHNDDGFRDLPLSDQINVANKWLYAADNGTQIRWGWKFVQENRLGGMLDYKNSMRGEMEKNWNWKETGADMPLYGSKIRNRGANGYFKIGMPVGPSVYDADEQDEMRSNLAFVADFDHFNENAYFGLNDYRGNENTLSLNLMYNHYFTYRSSLIVGAQGHLQYYRESFATTPRGLRQLRLRSTTFDRNEQEVGAYAEYTYSIKDKFSVVAGIRGDYNAFYDKFFVTPRGHIRWNITPSTTLRGSAGLGYPFDQRHHRQHRYAGDRTADRDPRFRWLQPAGEGAHGGRKPHADLRAGQFRRRDAEFRLFPHAVLQLGDRRPGVQRRPDRAL